MDTYQTARDFVNNQLCNALDEYTGELGDSAIEQVGLRDAAIEVAVRAKCVAELRAHAEGIAESEGKGSAYHAVMGAADLLESPKGPKP